MANTGVTHRSIKRPARLEGTPWAAVLCGEKMAIQASDDDTQVTCKRCRVRIDRRNAKRAQEAV